VTRYRDKIHTEMRHREVYETRDTGGKKLHRRRGEEEVEEDICGRQYSEEEENVQNGRRYNESGDHESSEDKKIKKL
jgi:hypothetical protein